MISIENTYLHNICIFTTMILVDCQLKKLVKRLIFKIDACLRLNSMTSGASLIKKTKTNFTSNLIISKQNASLQLKQMHHLTFATFIVQISKRHNLHLYMVKLEELPAIPTQKLELAINPKTNKLQHVYDSSIW